MQKELIQKQINQLSNSAYISNLQFKDQADYSCSTIVFVFTVNETQTIYDNYPFSITVKLSQGYPEQPPSIFFNKENIIYHLNVNQQSGQLVLSAIKDDWSQFLSLSTIVEVLQSSLIQPDISTFASKEMMIQYKHKIQQYWAKAQKKMEQLRTQKQNKQKNEQNSSFDSPKDIRKLRRPYTQPDDQQSDFTFSKNYFSTLSQQEQERIIKQKVQKIAYKKNQNFQQREQSHKFENSKTQKYSMNIKQAQQANQRQTVKNFSVQGNFKKNGKQSIQSYQVDIMNLIQRQKHAFMSKEQYKNLQFKNEEKNQPKNIQKHQQVNQVSTKIQKESSQKQNRPISKRAVTQFSQINHQNAISTSININMQQQKLNNETSVLQEKLKRAISTLNIFTQQCLTIQGKLKTASHPKLRKILQSQLDQQIEDIQQISQVVANLKKTLIRKVKLDGIVN